MAFIADYIFDLALAELDTNGSRLDVTNAEATTYTEATANPATGFSLGNKTALSIGAPQDGAVSGRRVIVASFSDGNITATGTASHWAITDGASLLMATGSLASSQAVTAANSFSLTAFDIEIQDAT
jgi:hypothetical protein